MERDLTVGEPQAVLRDFCLPLFGSVVFQQLDNIADSLVAGKFVGETALAAVGNSYEITLIFLALAFGHRHCRQQHKRQEYRSENAHTEN